MPEVKVIDYKGHSISVWPGGLITVISCEDEIAMENFDGAKDFIDRLVA